MPDQPKEASSTRRLAAIMFTDIVGYTAIMQQDEEKALRIINRHRSVVENYTTQHSGEVLQYYGDGSLSIFPSASEAVACAIEIQEKLIADLKVPLRIGIHLGDIKIQGESVFGDGVNMASRIESLGIAGSILISDTIYHLVRNQPGIRTASLGTFELKNVDYPVPVYALQDDFLAVPAPDDLPGKIKTLPVRYTWIKIIAAVAFLILAGYILSRFLFTGPALSGPVERSVAVLPFNNLSDDPQQEYFSDGITDDVINHLARISGLEVKSRTTTEQYKNPNKTIPVIGRELGVAYILEGSVRKAGNTVRIVAQLIDVKNDTHVWTETFDREITEIFEIQSEIAIEIAGVLETRLTSDERRHIRGRRWEKGGSPNITAYDYLLRARRAWRNWNDENDLENAVQLTEEAIELDPNLARGYVLKGNILHYGMRQFGVPTDVWIGEAFDLANKAIRIDTMLATAYLLKGNILSSQEWDCDEALENLKKAYYLEPGNPEVLQSLGNMYMRSGQYEKGASLIIRSIEREYSPKDPEYYFRWGSIFMMTGNHETAEQFFRKSISLAPGWINPYYTLGQLYRYRGELDASEKTLKRGLEIAPLDQETIDALGWTNLLTGDLGEAAEYWSSYEVIEGQFPDSTQYIPFRHRLGYVLALQGDTASAMRLIREQRRIDMERFENIRGYGAWMSGGFYYDLAATNAWLGNREEAVAWLDSASQMGFMSSWYLENDPLLENVRDDAGFARIRDDYQERRQRRVDAFEKAIEENQDLQQEFNRLPLNMNTNL